MRKMSPYEQATERLKALAELIKTADLAGDWPTRDEAAKAVSDLLKAMSRSE